MLPLYTVIGLIENAIINWFCVSNFMLSIFMLKKRIDFIEIEGQRKHLARAHGSVILEA